MSSFAQLKPAKIADQYRNLKATKVMKAVDEPINFSTVSNPTVAATPSKSINEVIIGTTRYDLQSNSSIQNRIYLYPDGTIGATFTYGITETLFPERGTGYNYFDGTAWGADPSARIENARCGWPSLEPLGSGELIVTHNGTTGLFVTKRATKGTGAWTTTTLVGPTGTGGTTALLWPRMITSGNTIHIIACTDQAVSPAVWYYEGMALAMVYLKSTDGGATWSAPEILPGMDSASIVSNVNQGFSGDSYSWAKAKGDTIAFVVGDGWQNVFVMKSIDGGDNWTKIPVYNLPTITAFPTPAVPSTDGSYSIALDNLGKAHVVLGIMRYSKSSGSPDSIGYTSYYPYTDGLVYWNETMAPLDSAQLGDLTGLNTAGQLLATMIDYNGDATINFPTVPTGSWPFGTYGGSLTSMPFITFDNAGNIYVSYSSCREDKIDATGLLLYRHLYIIKKDFGSSTWSNPTDLTDNVIHDYDECVFGSMSYTSDNRIHLMYQADETPGTAVKDLANWGDNRIYYTNILKTDIGATDIGVSENQNETSMSIYPNPSTDYTNIDLNLTKSSNVTLTVTDLVGKQIMNTSFGQLSSGNHNLAVSVTNFKSGIYFFTVQTADSKTTRKIVID
ncbi:MAG: T9SS type A sorting domain-containing protein [Bacteroidota bacterium]